MAIQLALNFKSLINLIILFTLSLGHQHRKIKCVMATVSGAMSCPFMLNRESMNVSYYCYTNEVFHNLLIKNIFINGYKSKNLDSKALNLRLTTRQFCFNSCSGHV